MITGVNHVTLACRDLDLSVTFYQNTLGAVLRARWDRGAYLEIGSLWLCLERSDQVSDRMDDSHVAFGCAEADFNAAKEQVVAHAMLWKDNQSEGASVYFLDPDGHKLELHVGNLETRLNHYRQNKPDVTVFDPT